MRNIVLTGFMGTGKTAIGKSLANILSWQFVDTDKIIEEREKMSINEIFQDKGESYFRDIESRVVSEVSNMKNVVVATGGGVVLKKNNMELLSKNGIIICLTASPEVIERRTVRDEKRPLLKTENRMEKIKELLEKRKPYYFCADLVIDTSKKKQRRGCH